jgi:hypothetical protein
MKTYYGNYLGMVVDDRDPQQRNRVKVFIPHIMPALYENWNAEAKDIKFNIVGTFDSENPESGPAGLNPEIIRRLQKILPWAECAAPIFGSAPAGIYNYETGEFSLPAANVGNGQFETSQEMAAALGGGPPEDGAISSDGLLQLEGVEVKNAFNENNLLGTNGWTDKGNTNWIQGIVVHNDGGKGNAGLSGLYNWANTSRNGYTAYITPDGTIHQFTPITYRTQHTKTYNGINNSNTIGIMLVGVDDGDVTRPNDPVKPPTQAQITSLAAVGRALGVSGYAGHGEYAGNKEKGEGTIGASAVRDRFGFGGVQAIASGRSALTSENPSRDKPLPQSEVRDTLAQIKDEEESPGVTEGVFEKNDAFLKDNNQLNGTNYILNIDGVTVLDNDGINQWRYASDGSGTIVATWSGTGWVSTNQQNISQQQPTVSVTGGPQSDETEPLPDLAEDTQNPPSISVTADNGDETATENTARANQPENPHPLPYPTAFGPDTNNVPKGFFGGAKAGQMVWVFFQEGNPLFPVYFAASYSEKEYANVYEHASQNKIKNVKTEGNTTQDPLQGSQNMFMGVGGGFGDKQIISQQPSGFEKDEFAFEIFGKNGSNLMFTFHATLLNSKYDFRQHTQADAHYITGGNRTDRTTGDHVTICEQDVICTIGNWSEEALQAASNIQEVIDRAMKAAKDTYEA